jgi:hypothetical protein
LRADSPKAFQIGLDALRLLYPAVVVAVRDCLKSNGGGFFIYGLGDGVGGDECNSYSFVLQTLGELEHGINVALGWIG